MPETKPKEATSLREPKPKKKLGLSVPPALRMPHDDLIAPQKTETTLPSLTRQTSMTSPSSLTRQAAVAPERNFHKVTNTITKEVIPNREFKGKSGQLYHALYGMTRGALVPARTVRISRPQLMKKAGIGSRVTFDSNVKYLVSIGLLEMRPIVGEHEGNEYTIILPEERSMPSLTSQSSETSETSSTQNLDRLVGLETSQTRQGSSVVNVDTYADPKTSFKTKDMNDDDEAFAEMVALLKQASKEVTGKESSTAEAARWKEVAELLTTELRIAAARTSVSSAPAFLAEHLRRRLRKADARQIEREVRETSSGTASTATSSKAELTHEEIEEQARLMTSLLRDGSGINELEEQFAQNFRPYQWHQIRSIALAQHDYTSSKLSNDPSET
jgi:hypothetical protein